MSRNRYKVASFVAILLFAFALPVSAGDNAAAVFSLVGGEETASVHPGESVLMQVAAAGLQDVKEIEISLVVSAAAFNLAATAYEIPAAWFVAPPAPAVDGDEAPALFSVGLKTLDSFTLEGKATITIDKIAITSLSSARDEFGEDDLALSLVVAPAQTAVLEGARPIAATVLEQNYPNPFNPLTNIRFELRQAAPVTLAVYNMAGQVVRTLVAGEQMAMGAYHMVWDGRNAAGEKVASGVYFYQLQAGVFTSIKKMALLQ